MIGKFVDGSFDSLGEAETALRRALELNPRLSVAHKFYANLEADLGQAPRALVRLLGEAVRHGNDPEIFAGLVHACRYCGLFDEAIAAHAEARRLDPNVATGLVDVLIMCLDLERLAALEPPTTTPDEGTRIIALGLTGRKDEARQMLIQLRNPPRIEAFHKWVELLTAWLNGRADEVIGSLSSLGNLSIQSDPEALFLEGWILCDAGEHQAGFEFIQRAVTKGYFVEHTLRMATQFDPLRGTTEFQALMQVAESGRQQALASFREAGGDRLLGTVGNLR